MQGSGDYESWFAVRLRNFAEHHVGYENTAGTPCSAATASRALFAAANVVSFCVRFEVVRRRPCLAAAASPARCIACFAAEICTA